MLALIAFLTIMQIYSVKERSSVDRLFPENGEYANVSICIIRLHDAARGLKVIEDCFSINAISRSLLLFKKSYLNSQWKTSLIFKCLRAEKKINYFSYPGDIIYDL